MKRLRTARKTTIGNIDLENWTDHPKRYRLVIDFDANGFWQLRRSLSTFPPGLLVKILDALKSIASNKK